VANTVVMPLLRLMFRPTWALGATPATASPRAYVPDFACVVPPIEAAQGAGECSALIGPGNYEADVVVPHGARGDFTLRIELGADYWGLKSSNTKEPFYGRYGWSTFGSGGSGIRVLSWRASAGQHIADLLVSFSVEDDARIVLSFDDGQGVPTLRGRRT